MFREKLTIYRERSGLNIKELAKRINVTPAYMSSLESGKRKPPTVKMCHQISGALALSREESRDLILESVAGRIKRADLEALKTENLTLSDLVRLTSGSTEQCPYCNRKY